MTQQATAAPTTDTRTSRALAWAGSRHGRLELLALAIVAAVLIVPSIGLMRYQGPPMEEGFMLAFPEQLLHGRLPHRDFLHLYGPGSLWVLAAVYWLIEPVLWVERMVGLAQHAAVAFGMYALLRPFGRRIATGSAVLSILLLIGPGGLSAMAWNGALGLGICSLAVGVAATHRPASRSTTALLALSGVLAGTALLYRPDMVIAVGLGLGAVVLSMEGRRRRPVLLGAGATLLLYVPHLLTSGIGNSIEGMFLDPVFALRAGRTLPVPPSWGEIDGFLQRAGALRRTGWPFPMPELSQQIHLWFWLVPVSIVVCLVAAWRLRRRSPGSAVARALWPAALFGAALLPQAMQRPDTTHLAWVTGVTFAVMIPSITSLLEGWRPSLPANARLVAAYGVIAVILLTIIPFYPARTYVDLVGQTFGRNQFGAPIRNGDRVFYFGDAEGAAQAQQVVDRLAAESEPGDRLIAGPTDLSRTNYNDAFFYALFPDLVPGTRYIEMDPGIANTEDSGLADELRANDWLILSDSSNLWNEPNDSALAGSTEPDQVDEELYCTVLDAGGFHLLQRCRDPA
jgi:hypothetical protein